MIRLIIFNRPSAFSLLKCIVMAFLCEVLFSTNIQSQTEWQNFAKVNSLNELVELITDSTNYSDFKRLEGGVSLISTNTPRNRVLKVSNKTNSTDADLITAFFDDEPIALLMRKNAGNHYQYFKAGPELFNGCWLEATARKNDGTINNVCLWKRRDQNIIAGTLNGGSKPDFLATGISNNLISIIFFADSSETDFKANLLYDVNLKSIVAASNLALTKDPFSSVFSRTHNGDWIEYVISNKNTRLSAVAMHDSVPGLLKRCMLDFDEDGNVDIQFGLSMARDSILLYSSGGVSLSDQKPDELIKIFQDSASNTMTLWNEVHSILKSSNALGYRLPIVQKLP